MVYPPSGVFRSAGLSDQQVTEITGVDDIDAVPIRPAPVWLRRMWRGPVAAMTLPWAIYVSSDRLTAPDLGTLLLHEMVHVRQWKRLGTFRFLRTYVRDYLAGRRAGLNHHHAYLGIRFEKEARAAVARHLATESPKEG